MPQGWSWVNSGGSHDRSSLQPPRHPARHRFAGGACRIGSIACSACAAPAAARALRHPQRFCHDHGARHRRHRRLRRAGARWRDRCGGTKAQCARGRGHQRRGDDRAAGAGRDPLAHVEHAPAQHVGRQAGHRLFPHHGGARPEMRACRHVPGHAAGGGRSNQFRHHLRARLVSQHPRLRLCGG